MSLHGKSFTSSLDIDQATMSALFRTADILQPVAAGTMKTKILDGLVAASLFFEPSTRTRLSFECAVARLGGTALTVTGTELTSLSKGESYEDTARVISGYCDVMILRTASPQISQSFFNDSTKPVINAGSGGDEHPTQALLDVYTIEQELSRRGKTMDSIHITLMGDLKYGRTIHSLIKMLRHYKDITFHHVAPQVVGLPENMITFIEAAGHHIIFHDEHGLPAAVEKSDVIYATRLQKERLAESEGLAAFPESLCVNTDLLDRHAKPDVIVMHPLPRDSRPGSNDLMVESSDPRLAIFKQTDNGVPVRMALIAKICGVSDTDLKASLVKS